MNACVDPSTLTPGRRTTILRHGRRLESFIRPFPYPEPKFVRMAETVTHIAGHHCHTPTKRERALFSKSNAPVTVSRVKWLERGEP